MTRFVLFALAILASTAHSQSAVPHPDARRLRFGTDSLEVYLVRHGQRQRTGLITDRLDTVRVKGELRLRRVYRTMDSVLGDGIDTLVDRFPDLQPRSVFSTSKLGGSERTTWTAGRVAGTVALPNHVSHAIDTTIPPGTFSGSTFDLVLRSSPLATGYAVDVPSFSGRQGVATLTAKVTAEEALPGSGRAWRVEANFAGLPVTFWIDQTSRRLLQQSMTVGPGVEVVFVAMRDSSTR